MANIRRTDDIALALVFHDAVRNEESMTLNVIGPYAWCGRNMFYWAVDNKCDIEFNGTYYAYFPTFSPCEDIKEDLNFDVYFDFTWPYLYGTKVVQFINKNAQKYADSEGNILSNNLIFKQINK